MKPKPQCQKPAAPLMTTRGSLESESAMKLPAVEITFGLLLLTDLQGFPLISI